MEEKVCMHARDVLEFRKKTQGAIAMPR